MSAATPSPSQGHDVRGGEQAAAGGAPAGGGEPSAGAPLVITVWGTPAPQGSKRHVGNGVMVESSKAVKPWREAVKTAARDLHHEGPLRLFAHSCGMAHTIVDTCLPPGRHVLTTRWQDAFTGPVVIEVTFTLRKPASAPKRRTTWPQRKPDLDKLLRSTFDALSDAGVWVDDSQVVEVCARKVFPDEGIDALPHPGAVIRVQEVTA